MKLIVYSKEEDGIAITNNEFEEAIVVWAVKSNYYCPRIGTLLSSRFLYVKPFCENQFYILKNGEYLKVQAVGKRYFYKEEENSSWNPIDIEDTPLLITEDEFVEKNNLLK